MLSTPTFAVRFWGTRGSIPTPGANTLRYGGNTPCVEVRYGDSILVFDAGTGIRGLGRALVREFFLARAAAVGLNPYWKA